MSRSEADCYLGNPAPRGVDYVWHHDLSKIEARVCKDMPADCCDYGVISFETGKEVCRTYGDSLAAECDAAYIAACNPQNIAAILDPLSSSQAREHGMREAIKPFAWIADIADRDGLIDDDFFEDENVGFRVRDFRRARAALQSQPSSDTAPRVVAGHER